MSKHKRSLCYFCGQPATTTEHAPPKVLFTGFDCDSITVPSCEFHNNNKSNDDQVFINGFIQSLGNFDSFSFSKLNPEVQKLIKDLNPYLNFSKKRLINVNVIDKIQNMAIPLAKITHITGNLKSWFIQLTAALVCDALGYFDDNIDWSKTFVKSNNWIPSRDIRDLDLNELQNLEDEKRNMKELEKNLSWINGWSAQPKPYPPSIYNFSLLLDEVENNVCFKHKFLGKFEWIVLFTAPVEAINKIKLKSKHYNKLNLLTE